MLDKTITLIISLPNCPRLSQFNLSIDEKFYSLVIPNNTMNIKEYSFTIQEVMDNQEFFFNGALIHYKFRRVIKELEIYIPNIKEEMTKHPENFVIKEEINWENDDEHGFILSPDIIQILI